MNRLGIADTAVGCILAAAGDAGIRPVPGTVLDSIRAMVVGELCAAVGLKCVDGPLDFRPYCRPVEPDDAQGGVGRASELLLAGTGFCVAGVRRFASGKQARTFAWPGPVFTRLLSAWSDLVGVDVAKPFTESAG
jgi:hypothetical protein